jgi:hypothetical protein
MPPQDFVKRCIRPCRTLFCGVSDPAGRCSAGIRPCRTLFCGVSDLAGRCSAGYQTLQDVVLRDIRPCRTLFCGVCWVSEAAKQVSAIKCTQLCHCLRGMIPRRILFWEFEPEFENFLGYELGTHMESIHTKPGAKNLMLLYLELSLRRTQGS